MEENWFEFSLSKGQAEQFRYVSCKNAIFCATD